MTARWLWLKLTVGPQARPHRDMERG